MTSLDAFVVGFGLQRPKDLFVPRVDGFCLPAFQGLVFRFLLLLFRGLPVCFDGPVPAALNVDARCPLSRARKCRVFLLSPLRRLFSGRVPSEFSGCVFGLSQVWSRTRLTLKYFFCSLFVIPSPFRTIKDFGMWTWSLTGDIRS